MEKECYLAVYFRGYDVYEDLVSAVVGKEPDGSGFSLFDGERDLEFYGSRNKLEAMRDILLSVKLSNRLRPALKVGKVVEVEIE